ncbi:MAG: OmpA family protein, partial [Muribaculaceae bacterium]|nr:OmpA family protein [Muribaculaceae bacterium]
MKKLFISALVAMGVIAVNAQNTLAPSKLTDNISVTIKGGATTPLQLTDDVIKDTRAVIGAEVRKQITPIFGLGVEGNWSINTDPRGVNTYVFDHSYAGVFGTTNLS